MEWDQVLFRKVLRLFQRFSHQPIDDALLQRTVTLEELQDRLELVAKALTGLPIQIKLAEKEGGFQGNIFFLPKQINCFETNQANTHCYLFRVCFLTIQQRLNINLTKKDEIEPEDRRLSDKEVTLILQVMLESWPGFHETIKQLTDEAQQEESGDCKSFLYGRKIAPTLWNQLEQSVTSFPPPEVTEEVDQKEEPETELMAPPCEEIEQLQIDEKKIQDFNLMHSFEKVETLDEFNGQWRDMDGADELSEHEEALEELRINNTVRTDVPTHSIFQADFLGSSSAPESGSTEESGWHILYPEWNYKKKAYHQDHCKVFPKTSLTVDPDYVEQAKDTHRQTMQILRKKLQSFHNEREKRRRQADGESVDIDALIDVYAEMQAGRTPHEKLYLSSRKKRRDVAVLMLIDTSLSTDAYSNNQRILDVEKQSVLMFSQLLEDSQERFQVDAFHSRTRNQCHYYSLKKFNEPWASKAEKVGGIQPAGYTRIGPAMRHATSLLMKEKAKHKWLLLLSDGKPNDYDRYEGNYGIHDVRQSIREAHSQNIHTYALAVEKEAKHYLPRMLGPNNYRILPRPEELPDALLYFYMRLLGSK